MKIVTYNLRGDFGVDGRNDFCFRKPLIRKKLHAEQPDIIGFQEVLPHMAAWLREILPGYCVVGCGRGENGRLAGEAMIVAFRTEKFNLIEMRTFWLSPTPWLPGSRYAEQSLCPRTATELVLLEYATDKVFRVVNTHLDHISSEARRLGLSQILQRMESPELFPDAPLILMGDFNAEPDSPELALLRDNSAYTNAAPDIGVTFHGFMGAEPPGCIDYIFMKGAARCTAAAKWLDQEDGVYLSDHYPVCAEIHLC